MRPLPSSQNEKDEQQEKQVVAICEDGWGNTVTFPVEDIELRPNEPIEPYREEGPVRVVSDTRDAFGTDTWNTKKIRFEFR